MENIILNALTDEEGYLDYEKVQTVLPKEYRDNIIEANRYIMELLAKTELDDEFINRYFTVLPLDTLLEHNEIPENIILKFKDNVFTEIIGDIVLYHDLSTFQTFLSKGFSYQLNEELITKIMNDLMKNPVEELIEDFSAIINAFCRFVSREFILENIHEAGYSILAVAIQRDDITDEDIKTHLDDMEIEEIGTWIWEFIEKDEEDDSIFTKENKELLYRILLWKANEGLASIE